MRSNIDYLEEELREKAVKEIRGRAKLKWMPILAIILWILLNISEYYWFPDHQSVANMIVSIILTIFVIAFMELWRHRPIGEEKIKERMEEMRKHFLEQKVEEIDQEIKNNKDLIEDVQDDLDDLHLDRDFIESMMSK
ncbi:MAG: hypothetical protein ACM3PZ_03265 [Bacillota bacterium]